ncbi:MAG TPA: hypothetical protein DIT01_06770 [Lentisphaeria bacterium]|nr:hypothetical protein [Lentisphaeria bacterium]|tara:strand:+ start:16883 stop:17449 length:567 start_codon:yes stop_codon:yes gene_type:complete
MTSINRFSHDKRKRTAAEKQTMKTYTRIMTPIIALAIIAAFCCIPRTAEAGDKEWATAGKILTGLVVLDALTDANHRYYGNRYANVRHEQPQQTYRRNRNRGTTARTTTYRRQRSNWRDRYDSPRVNTRWPVYRTETYECRTDPVIRYIEYGTRRIYQPRIRGHVAYVQRWSSCDNNWVTIGTCESIY